MRSINRDRLKDAAGVNTRFPWLCGYYNAAGFPFIPVVSVTDTMHCIFLFILQVKEDSL